MSVPWRLIAYTVLGLAPVSAFAVCTPAQFRVALDIGHGPTQSGATSARGSDFAGGTDISAGD